MREDDNGEDGDDDGDDDGEDDDDDDEEEEAATQKLGPRTLCAKPAQLKCTSTCHKGHF